MGFELELSLRINKYYVFERELKYSAISSSSDGPRVENREYRHHFFRRGAQREMMALKKRRLAEGWQHSSDNSDRLYHGSDDLFYKINVLSQKIF